MKVNTSYRAIQTIEGILIAMHNGQAFISFDFYGKKKTLYFKPYDASMEQILLSNIGKQVCACVEIERNAEDWQDVKGVEIITLEIIKELDKKKVEADFRKLMNKLNVKDLTETIIKMRHEE